MASESTIACPCCGRESKPPHRNTTFPFCSSGCKLADLGRWLDGAYALDPESGRLEVVDPDEAEELDPDALH